MRTEASAAYLLMGVAHPEWQERLCIGTDQMIAAVYDPDGGGRLWRALRPEIASRVSAVIARREDGEVGKAMADAAASVLADCSTKEVEMDRYIKMQGGVATAYDGAEVTDRVEVQFGDVVTLGDDGRVIVRPHLADVDVPVIVPGVVIDGVGCGPFVYNPRTEAAGTGADGGQTDE